MTLTDEGGLPLYLSLSLSAACNIMCVSLVSLFLKHWKKNYWDINHLPYYTQHCYEVSNAAINM